MNKRKDPGRSHSRSGNRSPLPENADKICASCGAKRGNVRKGWSQITRGDSVVGWTCPECPRADEPIRRTVTGRGAVRFRSVVDATPPGARQRKQATRTSTTLEDARTFVEQVREEVRQAGAYSPAAVVTLTDAAGRYVASRVDIRPVTREGYRAELVPVLRHLGDRPVPEITSADVRELVTWLSEHGASPTPDDPEGRPLTPRSVRASVGRLSMVLDQAVQDGLVERNVSKGVKRPRQVRTVGTALEHWQSSELLRFRETADQHPWAGAWRLTLSGMTRADVMGLRWEDVDLEAGTVTVRQGRVQLAHGGQSSVVDEPKSYARRRTIPVEVIHPGTVSLLRTMRRQQMEHRLAAGGAWQDSGLVIVDALGRGILPESYSDKFAALCRQAEVPVIRLHSVRHSLAFWLHQLGVAPADAAALLGHTVEVHLSTYLPDSGSTGIAAAAAAMARASSSVTA